MLFTLAPVGIDMSTEPTFGEQLETQTDAYLDRLKDCVSLLPEVIDRYENEGDYRETVDRIQALESECDDMALDITALITNAGPKDMGLLNTRINFNQSALVAFYQKIDVMANITERIGQEIIMMNPPHGTECFEGLREMAEEVVSMMTTLEDVVERFVHNLGDPDASESLTEEIQSIRDTETRCDEIRNDVIATAFRNEDIDQPLMYREFAILFDELANTMEDVTDQIIIITSDEPGIVTEAGTDQS